MKISLDALALLDAIDTRGSFAAAAEALHRVPSTVTHAVHRLEEDLGLALFEREGRRALLTPAGRTLLEGGRHLLEAAGALECKVRRVATGWETELRIAVDAMIDVRGLFPLLHAFDGEAPDTHVRLSSEVLGGCWDALATGRADLAIGANGEAPPGGGWATRPIGDGAFVFAVAPDHPLASEPEPLDPARVRRHRAIALADTSRRLLGRTVGLRSGQSVLTVPDVATKLAAQVAGLGVGYLPRALAEREASAGRLAIRAIAEPRATASLCMAWRRDHEGRALAWFVERLDEPALRALLAGDDGPSTADVRRSPASAPDEPTAAPRKPARPGRTP